MLTQSIQEEIVRLYTQENKSYNKISKHLTVSIAQIRKCLRDRDIKGKPFKFYKRGTRFNVEEICQAYLSGKSGHEIDKELNLPTGTSYRCLKMGGVTTRPASEANRKYSADFDYFEKIDSQNKAQILGFVSADGCITQSKSGQKVFKVDLSPQDTEYLEWIKKELRYTGPLTFKTNKQNGKEYICLAITSPKIFSDLTNLGVTVRKTLVLAPPARTWITDNFCTAYVRGYFEGDGCIFIGGPNNAEAQLSIAGTKSVLSMIRDYAIRKLSITCSVSKIKGKRCYSFVVNGNRQILKFMNFIYNGSEFQMRRKYEKYLHLKSLFNPEGTKRIITFFKNRKVIYIKSPDGKIWHVKNVSAFAREQGLQPAHVGNLLAGRLKRHGQWARPTQEEIDQAITSGSLVTKFYPDL